MAQYVLLFLEGIITFISPCLLPMLPVYLSYFAGGTSSDCCKSNDNNARSGVVLKNAIGFVVGFTIIFILIGAFAGTAGRFFLRFGPVVDIVMGLIVVMVGLNYMGVINLKLGWHRGRLGMPSGVLAKPMRFWSAFVFGVVFSVAWTPCVSAFLASALMRAAQSGSTSQGMFMLFVFSMGLGIPFIASAVLIHKLRSAFQFIQRHYRVINIISGCILVLVGILMMTGLFGLFLRLFALIF